MSQDDGPCLESAFAAIPGALEARCSMKPIVLAGLAAVAFLQTSATDKPVKLSDMPLVVQQTIREQTRGAIITGTLVENENGKILYECESLLKGQTRDFLVDDTGAVVELEDQVSLEEVPQAVKIAVQRVASGGRLTKLERVKRGNTITYEAAVMKNGKKTGMELRPDGSPLKKQ